MTWVPKRTVHTTKKENIYMATRILKPNLSSAFKRIVKLFNSIFFVTKEARYSISGFLGSTTLEFRNPSIIKVPKKFSTLPRSCWYYKFRGKKVTHPFEARRETLTHSRWYGSAKCLMAYHRRNSRECANWERRAARAEKRVERGRKGWREGINATSTSAIY